MCHQNGGVLEKRHKTDACVALNTQRHSWILPKCMVRKTPQTVKHLSAICQSSSGGKPLCVGKIIPTQAYTANGGSRDH